MTSVAWLILDLASASAVIFVCNLLFDWEVRMATMPEIAFYMSALAAVRYHSRNDPKE